MNELSPWLHAVPCLQRAQGRLDAVFGIREQKSKLLHLYQAAPCRGLFPVVDLAEPPQLVLVNTGGGIVGGDHLAIQVAVEAGASATVTSATAEKIYRARHDTARLQTTLTLGCGSYTEYLPQETIYFDRARLDRRLAIHLSAGASLLATEMMVLGRRARGERLTAGFLRDAWEVRLDGKPLWMDALGLSGNLTAERTRPFGIGDTAAYATLLLVSPKATSLLAFTRDILCMQTTNGAATIVNGMLLVRFLEPDAQLLRQSVCELIMALRHAARDLPRRLPRVWLT